MNVDELPGRLICGLAANRLLGPVNTLIPVALICGVLLYCWAAVDWLGSLFTFCVIYGYFATGIQSLFPAACASLTSALTKMGVWTGMCFSVISITCLTGSPLAGTLIQKNDGGFSFAQAFGGSAFIGGSLILAATKMAMNGSKLRVRM